MMTGVFDWRTRVFCVTTRRNGTRPLRDARACPPSHLIAPFCALSRYGVTTDWPDLDADFGGIRDVCERETLWPLVVKLSPTILRRRG